ncbi:MAG: aminotransferase class V-fold PLP-dependent enzyme [Candidatus Omnitrophica bacterium]|nr:aminotransferase class V-fold PLP-dependent enzyme [Candidatus Omnitrophota bacterium]
MTEYKKDFFNFEDVIWLNAASEGPLPLVAAEALKEAIQWKSAVHLLDIPRFIKVPLELKKNIAQLLNVESRDVILGTSASYGLHILANGIKWQKGDEVLLMQNDFPSNIIPWLGLEKKGVIVKQIKPQGIMLTPDELNQEINPRTRLVCLSHIHSFSGHPLNVDEISKLCQKNGIRFVLNIVQSLGNTPLDIGLMNVDAIVAVGYKWLCGPYGTGFCWMKEDFRQSLDYNQAYWSSYLSEEDLKGTGPIHYRIQESARKFDTFGTANFFNFVPLTAAIQYFLGIGIEQVKRHNQSLINYLIEHLDPKKYQIISPTEPQLRSNLFVFSHHDHTLNETIFSLLLENKIHPAFWKGNLRFSPHIYNSIEDLQKVILILNKF